jgi:hypothetical protein
LYKNDISIVCPKGQTKLLTELLNLELVKVTKYQNLPGIGLVFHLETLTKEALCDRCGTKSNKIHQNHHYLVSQGKIMEVMNSWGAEVMK